MPIPFLLSSRGPGLLLASSYRSDWRLDSPDLKQELRDYFHGDEDSDDGALVLGSGLIDGEKEVEIPPPPISFGGGDTDGKGEGVVMDLGSLGEGQEESGGLMAVARRERQRQLRGPAAAAAGVGVGKGEEEEDGGAYEFVVGTHVYL